jgi:hypothetical protein
MTQLAAAINNNINDKDNCVNPDFKMEGQRQFC